MKRDSNILSLKASKFRNFLFNLSFTSIIFNCLRFKLRSRTTTTEPNSGYLCLFPLNCSLMDTASFQKYKFKLNSRDYL